MSLPRRLRKELNNAVLDIIRKRNREMPMEEIQEELFYDDTFEKLCKREDVNRMLSFIDDKHSTWKTTLLLWAEGTGMEEIARIQGVSSVTVRTRLNRVRKMIKDKFCYE